VRFWLARCCSRAFGRAREALHASRKGVLTEEHRPKVFTSKRPHSLGTFLMDGTVAGAWWHRGDRVEVEPWEPIADATRRELDGEAARLARFMS